MSARARQLQATTDRQINELIELLSRADDEALRRPCPGRDKLGDGTARALAVHVTDNYQRIGGFVAGDGRGQEPRRWHPGHMKDHRHDPGGYFGAGSATPANLIERLSAARHQLAVLAQLTDAQLDGRPPQGSVRFADGQRTLEQVLAGLFKHQGHQLGALAAVLG